jgi:TatD DNase family protein
MPVSLFDTHAHLDMHQFDPDRPQVVNRALHNGVSLMVNPAVDIVSSEKIIKMTLQDPHLYAAIGFHPQEAARASEPDMNRLRELARSTTRVVAIGETGLDFFRNRASQTEQIRVFQLQLDLAAELSLPVIVHSREAVKDTLALLGNWIKSAQYHDGKARGVIHCFSGDIGLARLYLEMGFYVAYGGYVTFPSSTNAETIRNIPKDRLLIETDCPYLAPQGHRGTRNEPAYILETATCIADILQMSTEEVGRLTTENARRLFGLDTG